MTQQMPYEPLLAFVLFAFVRGCKLMCRTVQFASPCIICCMGVIKAAEAQMPSATCRKMAIAPMTITGKMSLTRYARKAGSMDSAAAAMMKLTWCWMRKLVADGSGVPGLNMSS